MPDMQEFLEALNDPERVEELVEKAARRMPPPPRPNVQEMVRQLELPAPTPPIPAQGAPDHPVMGTGGQPPGAPSTNRPPDTPAKPPTTAPRNFPATAAMALAEPVQVPLPQAPQGRMVGSHAAAPAPQASMSFDTQPFTAALLAQLLSGAGGGLFNG